MTDKKQITKQEAVQESSKKDDGARPPVNSQQDHVAENLAGSDAARELQNPHLPAPQGIAAPIEEDADEDGRIKRRSLYRGSVVFLPGDAEHRTPITLEEDAKVSYDGMGSDKRFAGMLSQDQSFGNFAKNIGQLKGTWNPLNGRLMDGDEEGIDMGPIPKDDEIGVDMGPIDKTADGEGVDLGKPTPVENEEGVTGEVPAKFAKKKAAKQKAAAKKTKATKKQGK